MTQAWRPALARGALLRYDPVRKVDVLLLPERAVWLNHSAGAILRLCDASHTPEEIDRTLRAGYREEGPAESQIRGSVARFLERVRALGWVR
jgi:pyrroloquinoline quinone biosynthesis protein D